MNEHWRTVTVPWRAPLIAAGRAGEQAGRELTLLTLTDDDGAHGYGEAAPLPGYSDGGADGAARDLAAWDLRARRAGVPVWRLLGGVRPPVVTVNATIGAVAPDQAAAEAADAVRAGFTAVKLKVGVDQDIQRVRAVRAAAGPDVALRIDANGAWSVPQAVRVLHELVQFRIECCEEPVHGLHALEQVARAVPQIPIAADETAAEPAILDRRVCAAICLKIVRCGGITGLLRDAERARAAGYELYLASTLDGPLGIAAAVHAAAALHPDRPSGLATLDRFARSSPFAPVAGVVSPPPGPGLGAGLVQWYQPS